MNKYSLRAQDSWSCDGGWLVEDEEHRAIFAPWQQVTGSRNGSGVIHFGSSPPACVPTVYAFCHCRQGQRELAPARTHIGSCSHLLAWTSSGPVLRSVQKDQCCWRSPLLPIFKLAKIFSPTHPWPNGLHIWDIILKYLIFCVGESITL